MNNLLKKMNNNEKIGVMLVYGENGSYIPINVFYLLSTVHNVNEFDLENSNVLYYNDNLFFVDNMDQTLIMNAQDAVKLFERYANIYKDIDLSKVKFDIFKHYENSVFNKYVPYSLDDLNCDYRNGLNKMGRNYSLIPIVLKKQCEEETIYYKEKYLDFNATKKLKKNFQKNLK